MKTYQFIILRNNGGEDISEETAESMSEPDFIFAVAILNNFEGIQRNRVLGLLRILGKWRIDDYDANKVVYIRNFNEKNIQT